MPSKYGFGNTRKKSPAYKMKGFSGFGNSPAKVSDSDILKLQGELDKAELDFKEPGWAKVAGKAFDPLGITGGGDKGGSGSGGGGGTDIAKTAGDVTKTVDDASSILSKFGELGGGGGTELV